MKKEIWKPVVGYEGLYIVSNYGHVRSLDRVDSLNRFRKGRLLKPCVRDDKYKKVSLSKDGIAVKVYIHRLVAEAFLPNPDCLPYVNHKDENPSNNYIFINPDGTVDPRKSNLEWCTAEYNNNYGTIKKRVSEKRKKKVIKKSLSGEFICEYDSLKEAAESVGLSFGRISACCLKMPRSKTAGGFMWEYA